MIHTYSLAGMHCGSCVGRVQQALEGIEGVKKAVVSLQPQEAVVNMSRHIETAVLNRAVAQAGAYSLSDAVQVIDTMNGQTSDQHPTPVGQTFVDNQAVGEVSATTYKPLLVIGAYLLGITALVEFRAGGFDMMRAMQTFMAGFFLTFSFFKLLDVKGFADSYRMYDIVAKRLPGYGLAYPFVELALGLAYATGWNPVVTNALTLGVMGVSLVGVLESVLNKRKIRCACLGSVFNLPMTTVTIVEDGLMIGMAALMLIWML
jgi:copper chaperone CopZ